MAKAAAKPSKPAPNEAALLAPIAELESKLAEVRTKSTPESKFNDSRPLRDHGLSGLHSRQ
jgi:hypothetical protein